MGRVVLPGLFIRVVGSMLYQLIEPGAKSKNLIDESCFNKQPPEHWQLQSGYMTRNSHEKRMSFYKVICRDHRLCSSETSNAVIIEWYSMQ